MTHVPKLDRREQILMVLANELENNLGSPITTSSLASAIGFSEAALYRHFASKSQMFESLINFAEQSVFSSINNILKQEKDSVIQIQKITYLILTFSERNPGVTRVLIGDVLLDLRDLPMSFIFLLSVSRFSKFKESASVTIIA